jgi:phosphohistidine phosphatase
MQLLLLRHGDAVSIGYDDAMRPLSVMGEEQSNLVARAMMHLELSPDLVLSSPLLRARQMAAIIGKKLDSAKLEISEHLVPGAEMSRLIDQLNTSGAASVLLVGHEPHLHTLLSVLLTDSTALHMRFGNGTMACIDVVAPIQPGTGTLEWLMRIEEMELLK